jgi:N-acetylmuramoyl-L-alanine amidase CwlA
MFFKKIIDEFIDRAWGPNPEADEVTMIKREKKILRFLQRIKNRNNENKPPILNAMIGINQFSRPGIVMPKVEGLVAHWVAVAGGTVQAVGKYFDRLKNQNPNDDIRDRYASTQFGIGLEGEILKYIPEKEMAYHVGAYKYQPGILEKLDTDYPNSCLIGAELCHPEMDGKFTEKTLNAAVHLFGHLCIKYNLDPMTQIYRHYDITGKDCPRWFVREPMEFTKFKKRVRNYIISLGVGNA